MDAHYDQVMRLRADLALRSAPPRRYFAYSTALDRIAFEAWRTEHGYGSFDLPKGVLAEAPAQAGDTGRDMTVLPPGTKAVNSSDACSAGGTACAAIFLKPWPVKKSSAVVVTT